MPCSFHRRSKCKHAAFWGEEEIQVVANMEPAKNLPNLWPATGLIGFEMDGPGKAFIVGFTKLIAISFTVAGGLRGGKCREMTAAMCTSSMDDFSTDALLLIFRFGSSPANLSPKGTFSHSCVPVRHLVVCCITLYLIAYQCNLLYCARLLG